jgi:hypothetical protein
MSFLASFKPLFVPGRYKDVVSRSAVIYPILRMRPKGIGGNRTEEQHNQAMISATHRLIEMWRARVLALSAHGWKYAGIVTGGDLYTESVWFMMNCCPCFTAMEPDTRCCNRRHVCPFCYARQVVGVWEAIDYAFPNVMGEVDPVDVVKQKCTEDVTSHHAAEDESSRGRAIVFDEDAPAVERRYQRVFPYHLVDVVYSTEYPVKRNLPLRDLISTVVASRRDGVDALDIRGAFINTTIEPWGGVGEDTGWVVNHRYLLMVPANAKLPDSLTSMHSYNRIKKPTRRRINNAVIRACSYPRQLMVGDARHVVRLLNSLSGHRMSAFYGEFRNALRRKREDDLHASTT